MNMTPNEAKQHLKSVAAECVTDAVKFRKAFRNAAIKSVGWLMVFVPFGFFETLYGDTVIRLLAIPLFMATGAQILTAIMAYKDMHESYNELMQSRQECLNAIVKIEQMEKDYDNPGFN